MSMRLGTAEVVVGTLEAETYFVMPFSLYGRYEGPVGCAGVAAVVELLTVC